MPRTCTICAHEQRPAIDRALVEGSAFRALSALYRVSEDAVARHKRDHLPLHLVQAQEAHEVADADDLLAQLRSLQTRTLGLLDQAERAGKLGTAVMAVREARSNIELIAELVHELDRRPVVNLWMSAEWQQVRAVLLSALLPYPEARAAVAQRLLEVEAG